MEPDGRLRVTNLQVTAEDIDANDFRATLPPGTTYYLPAGSYVAVPSPFPGVTNYEITSTVPLEQFDGSPLTGDVTYSSPVVSFSHDRNAVTLGEGSETVDNAVSVGATGATRKITNLAAGTQSSDLLTYGQLMDTQAILDATPPRQMRRAMDSSFRKINGISAMSVAMSALQANPGGAGNGSISLGIGSYDGETAYALGSHFTLNDTITLSLGAAANGASEDFQISVGLGYSW